jgi:DNA replication protein DnaC
MATAPSTKSCAAEIASCPLCDGEGVVVQAQDELAHARLCDHVATCKTCRGQGFLPGKDELGYEVLTPCKMQALKARMGRFNQAGLPAGYAQATLESWQPHTPAQRDLRQRVGAWQAYVLRQGLDQQGKLPKQLRGIGLTGAPGVGKTHLMAALARSLTLELGVAVRFADFSQLLWDLKAGFQAGRGEADLVAPLATVDVLLIDELGKGRASEWEISILDSIISARYNRGLTTFFSTNYPMAGKVKVARSTSELKETLSDRVGDRIASRLSAMCDVFEVDGADQRPATWVSKVGK